MFTGIVLGRGTVHQIEPMGADSRLHINSGSLDLSASQEGDSIAVSGACLTMLEPRVDGFCADVSTETLELTTLGTVTAGRSVNLEPALSLSQPLGGHLVTGHVDGVGTLISRKPDGRAERFEFELPRGLGRYVARKGSVCVDGVSLTVNGAEADRFSVCLIPHTLEVTTLGGLAAGDGVNIEIDLLARYVERLGEYS
ncbi:riboflavin synthase [Elongatibacter sediminis]|uniref:Riboflavin synthase n=1 Tax=Elongatibacter sediminis TaxID=3119006 RepID=A0AAW9RGV3_9GAMM